MELLYKGKCIRSIPHKKRMNDTILCSCSDSGASSVPIPRSQKSGLESRFKRNRRFKNGVVFRLRKTKLTEMKSVIVHHFDWGNQWGWTVQMQCKAFLVISASHKIYFRLFIIYLLPNIELHFILLWCFLHANYTSSFPILRFCLV